MAKHTSSVCSFSRGSCHCGSKKMQVAKKTEAEYYSTLQGRRECDIMLQIQYYNAKNSQIFETKNLFLFSNFNYNVKNELSKN